jgi:lipopolysaccharide transport system permease protein
MTRYQYWNLLRELTLSQIKLKDQSTFFGFVWSFLNPLILVLVLFIFFQARLAENIQFYPLYLLIGVVHYTHFAHSSNSAMHVLYSMRQLTTEVVFPKEIMVVGSVLANSLEFVLEMAVIVVIAAVAGLPLTSALAWLPFVMVLQVLFVLWVSLALACLYVFVRDIEHLYSVLLRLLLFMTPIFYAPTFLGADLARWIVRLNPLAQLMTFSRGIVLEGVAPPWTLALLFLFANLVAVFLAWRLFQWFEPRFAERV